MEPGDGKKVFLEVRDPRALVDDVTGGPGLFVPTRLPLALGTRFTLAVRFRDVTRSIELPMTVIGRRVPRNGSLLSAGVVARLADPDSAMFALLREVAGGKVIDLEARLQEQVRVTAAAQFASADEAALELRALLEGPAHFPLDRLVQRGDRLALDVTAGIHSAPLTVHVNVNGVGNSDGRRSALVEILDDKSRRAVAQWLARLDRSSAQA